MNDPIPPIRPAKMERRAQERRLAARRGGESPSHDRPQDPPRSQSGSNLPVPVGTSRKVDPAADRPDSGAAAFAAQLLGQDGQKRGLKGGPPVLEGARSAYLETEYSGRQDRRPRPGRITKTEI